MSTENSLFRLPYEAYEDLSDYQYHFVKHVTGPKIALMDLAIDPVIGVLQDEPESGQAGSVMLQGITKVVANGALAVGTFVKPEFVSTTDCGKAQDCGADRSKAVGVVVGASAAEDDLCSVLLLPRGPEGIGIQIKYTTVTTEATAGDVTFTAAQILGGIILRDPAGGARADLVPTAANIIAAIPGAAAGDSFEFTIRNTADASETITVTTNTGVTLSGTMTIAQNNSKRFLCVVTSSTTVTIYSLGTIVH